MNRRLLWSGGLAVLFALFVAVGVARCPAALAPAPPAPHYGAGQLTAAGDGIPHIRVSQTQAEAGPVDVRDPRDFFPAIADAGTGFYAVQLLADGGVAQAQLTTDVIASLPPAFTVSLAFASGSGTYELSQPATPTYNATPATNAGTVTSCTIADNQGHSASAISHANPINVDTPAGPHSYALTSAGTVQVTVTETQVSSGLQRSGSATLSYVARGGWHGVDSHAGGNAITASGNNATLSGGSATATLTGSSLTSNFVGTSFTETPSFEYIYAAYPHTGSPHQFSAGGFFFPMSVVVPSFSFTNQWGQTSIPVDIYRSDNLLNATFNVLVTQ